MAVWWTDDRNLSERGEVVEKEWKGRDVESASEMGNNKESMKQRGQIGEKRHVAGWVGYI